MSDQSKVGAVDGIKNLLEFIREEDRLSELDWLKGMVNEYERLIKLTPYDRDADAEAEMILSVKRLYDLLKPLSVVEATLPPQERDFTPEADIDECMRLYCRLEGNRRDELIVGKISQDYAEFWTRVQKRRAAFATADKDGKK